MFELEEKTILVIGGRGYLGKNFCSHLKAQGATVLSADLPDPSPAAKHANNPQLGHEVIQKIVDVTNDTSVSNLVDSIMDEFGVIDVLVYCASMKTDDFFSPLTECSFESWTSVLEVELSGLFRVIQKVGSIMEHQKYGNIILLSSIYGVVGNDQRIYQNANLQEVYLKTDSAQNPKKRIYAHAVYSVAKGGLISLTRYLAAYWGEKRIRVNCVSPGGVTHPGENKNFVENYSARVPLGRKAELSEVSAAIVFLASDEASYITGQNIIVDGGWTAW